MTETEIETANKNVAFFRERIAEIDDQIAALIVERRRLSLRTQYLKAELGLTRIDVQQENKVVQHYQSLGTSGPAVALAILKVCRGAN